LIEKCRKQYEHSHNDWFLNQISVLETEIPLLRQQIYNVTSIKNQYKWLCKNKNLDSLMFFKAKSAYQAAWNMFRKVHHAGIPKFHKKSYNLRYQTAYLKYNIELLDRTHVKLPKIGRIRIKQLPNWLMKRDDIKLSTVSLKMDACGRYYISFQLASNNPFKTKLPKTNHSVGIDLNLENFLTDSDNNIVDNPHFFQKSEAKLAKAQRVLSRRKRRAKKENRQLKDAKNYQKQRQKVAFLHRRVRQQRQNLLHQTSKAIIENQDLVITEELRSQNLLKNHALANRISDVGWRTFLAQLEYKAELYGKEFRTVNPRFTTQICHDCGFRMGTHGTHKLTLDMRQWTCPHCHSFHIRDHNAALNIKAKGLANGPTVKQSKPKTKKKPNIELTASGCKIIRGMATV
jgi:putative transposase